MTKVENARIQLDELDQVFDILNILHDNCPYPDGTPTEEAYLKAINDTLHLVRVQKNNLLQIIENGGEI